MAAKLAVQLFTLREFTKTAVEFGKSLEKVRAMGYTGVQLSAVGCMNGENPEVDAKTARKMLDDNGLKCVATHRSFDQLVNQTEAEIEFHQTLGCKYVAIGSLPRDKYHTRGAAGYREFVADARPMAEKLRAAGLIFGYHNHAHEFIPGDEQYKTCYDLLIGEGSDFLAMEIDTHWVVHAGADPVVYIRKCPGRVQVIHLKDKAVDIEEGPIMAPIGEGNLNWDAIIPAFQEAGCEWMAVEQDRCYGRDPFDCLKSSYDFVHERFGID
ncbi:MAG: sugar phosphate isomerase/epimerase [Lentisphaerae bacterium]|nr:MAG: sugar phosphate isomerase/epimerase [Lentisphaerota bacterium]